MMLKAILNKFVNFHFSVHFSFTSLIFIYFLFILCVFFFFLFFGVYAPQLSRLHAVRAIKLNNICKYVYVCVVTCHGMKLVALIVPLAQCVGAIKYICNDIQSIERQFSSACYAGM